MNSEKILCLDIIEHIRKRPGLYIADTNGGSSAEDGIYSLLREVVENAIDEYWECVPNGEMPIDNELALKQAINSFLEGLDARTRIIFMRRYWYSMSVTDIAFSMRLSESHVSVILHRTRNKFKAYLTKEGIFV